jgi:hypothetical protein
VTPSLPGLDEWREIGLASVVDQQDRRRSFFRAAHF